MLFATGCRLSELCGLTRRRLNLKTREVEVLDKRKKVRGSFLTAAAAERLGWYLATRKDSSPYVFVSRQGVRRVRDPRTGVREIRKGVYRLAPRTVQALVEHLGLRAALRTTSRRSGSGTAGSGSSLGGRPQRARVRRDSKPKAHACTTHAIVQL